jgi:mannose-1-phosphate guanylyltransferase
MTLRHAQGRALRQAQDNVPALVLTAGLATRLRPLSLVRAKAALPVAGTPLVIRILQWLRDCGITDAVLNLHHLPHTLAGCVGDGSSLEMRVRYSWEVPILGSAGGPRRAIPLLLAHESGPRHTFVIVNGDTLTDLDVSAVIDDHRSSGALATLAVVPHTEPDKYGGVLVAADGAVTGFVPVGSHEPSFHFFGVQVVEAEAFARVPENMPFATFGRLYPELIAERRGSVRAFRCSNTYLDIGTPSDYLTTSLHLASREGHATLIGARTRIDESASVDRSILWDDVVIDADVMLRDCVVTDGVTVPADTSWHGVSIRKATGELAPGEKQIDGLAIAPL